MGVETKGASDLLLPAICDHCGSVYDRHHEPLKIQHGALEFPTPCPRCLTERLQAAGVPMLRRRQEGE